MPTLILKLTGPLQSWGTSSRFSERDAGSEPSKSGVLGLLCACLGRDRAEPIDDLIALRMGVRIDRPGMIVRDYHTALDVVNATGDGHGTVLTNRYYLADAAFWVGLEGDNTLLESCLAATRAPVWPIFLGRKSCPPSDPVWDSPGVVPDTLEAALSRCSWLGAGVAPEQIRAVLEAHDGEQSRHDQPCGTFSTRAFTLRRVRQEMLPCT